jgi:hypothetical protein
LPGHRDAHGKSVRVTLSIALLCHSGGLDSTGTYRALDPCCKAQRLNHMSLNDNFLWVSSCRISATSRLSRMLGPPVKAVRNESELPGEVNSGRKAGVFPIHCVLMSAYAGHCSNMCCGVSISA